MTSFENVILTVSILANGRNIVDNNWIAVTVKIPVVQLTTVFFKLKCRLFLFDVR